MMRLDTDPTTSGPRTGRKPADPLPLLIQVPRVSEPPARLRSWRPESGTVGHRAWRGSSRPATVASARTASRPRVRRKLRRGVRRAAWAMLFLAAMAGTFTIGRTTHGGGDFRLPTPRTSAPGLALDRDGRWSDPPAAVAIAEAEAGTGHGPDREGDAIAIEPALGAPVADAEGPVIFPGYLLPDNNREEPAHEGS